MGALLQNLVPQDDHLLLLIGQDSFAIIEFAIGDISVVTNTRIGSRVVLRLTNHALIVEVFV